MVCGDVLGVLPCRLANSFIYCFDLIDCLLAWLVDWWVDVHIGAKFRGQSLAGVLANASQQAGGTQPGGQEHVMKGGTHREWKYIENP